MASGAASNPEGNVSFCSVDSEDRIYQIQLAIYNLKQNYANVEDGQTLLVSRLDQLELSLGKMNINSFKEKEECQGILKKLLKTVEGLQ